MTPEELVKHATRFVLNGHCVINLYYDAPQWGDRWQVHTLKDDNYHLDKRVGYNLTLDKAVEMATKGTT